MPALDRIDHFIVLMLENRSFDKLFGRLHPAGPDFDVLPDGAINLDLHGHPVTMRTGKVGTRTDWMPEPDPGEGFCDIHEQLFGTPWPSSGAADMSGFARNYERNGGRPADIMHGLLPEQLPALSALARGYAVCDRWFASAPCQTWPNRYFVHCGRSGGIVNNKPVRFPYEMPTIFSALEAAPALRGRDAWRVYYHDFPQCLTLSELWQHYDRFRRFEEHFAADLAAGDLPAYTFIEPRYFADREWPNDMHPPHNVVYGDELVASVYNTLCASPAWEKSMLVILFDEHGGCYDHVVPPAATPTGDTCCTPGFEFAFDRMGVRVPAVVISPWISPGTRFRSTLAQAFDHTSVIRTLRKRFGIEQALSPREAAAPDLEPVLNLDRPSDAGRFPVTTLARPAEDDGAALERARCAPPTTYQMALHEASAWLQPLADGSSPERHCKALREGLRLVAREIATVDEAITHITRLIARLL